MSVAWASVNGKTSGKETRSRHMKRRVLHESFTEFELEVERAESSAFSLHIDRHITVIL